jgi:hypothetical protein
MSATFTDIVKEQRSQGAGVFSSLGKAAGQRTLERIDPRNYLFNRKGLAAALFPGLKGYQAKAGTGTSKLSDSTSTLSSSQTDSITSKLDELKAVQQETAKNTFVLPSMARDMNVMRQNIIKLVKLNGGKPSNRADSFFLTAKQREDAYETKFGKKSPTQVKDEKEMSRCTSRSETFARQSQRDPKRHRCHDQQQTHVARQVFWPLVQEQRTHHFNGSR